MSNNIIYGKNPLNNIVSIEVTDDTVEIFREVDGKVIVEFDNNKYWILCNEKVNNSWIKLEGNLHYSYGKQYSTREEFIKDRQKLKKHYDIYSIYNPKEALMVKDGYTYYKDLHPKDVSVLSFDIESYGLLHEDRKETYIISNTFRNKFGTVKRLFSVDNYKNELEMIHDWCKWVRQVDPSIIVGHNVFGYDFPYLQACVEKYGASLPLGRNGSDVEFNHYTSEYRVDGSQTWEYKKLSIYGREVIDTSFLSVKYDIGREFPSWALKSIIDHLGLVKEDRQFYDASKIRDNWNNPVEREKIKKYAEDDSDDALVLFDLMIPSFFYMSQSIPKPFQEVITGASGSWLNSIFVRAYLQDRHSIPKASDVHHYEGAISYGIPGIYSNVWKIDVASLYPSIMRHYKICDVQKDPKRYFTEIVENFTIERLRHKQLEKETGLEYHKSMQNSLKILINSLYGFMGAPGLNFNSPFNASEVTRYGREILDKAIVWATGHGIEGIKENHISLGRFQLVNCDTDSISICKQNREEFTESEIDLLLEDINSIYPDLINWEDDGYYDRGIVFKAKNYVFRDAKTKKIKIKGSALKDSKKEPALKEMSNEVIVDLLDNHGENLDGIYMRYVYEIINGIKDISRWCVKKNITKAVLENERTNESKVRDAFDGNMFSEGEKIYVFNDIEGMTPAMAKGEIIRNKKGEIKYIENKVLKLKRNFTGSYDKVHYLGRIYKTMEIFKTVLSLDNIVNYSLIRNQKMLGIDKSK